MSLFDLMLLHCRAIFSAFICCWAIIGPCSVGAPAAAEDANKLVVCHSSPFVSLDPTNHRDRNTQIVLKNMFDSLTTRNESLEVVPQLAESWEALNDMTWRFKLRRGVRFHNGAEFTAEDVVFTLERVIKEGALDGKSSPRKTLFGPISAVRMIDDYTVHIETERPWPILPLMLTLQEILPAKYMQDVGAGGFHEKPIGTGPFKLVRADGNKYLLLERFEEYYGGSLERPPVQAPPLKNLAFKIVPERIDRIAQLKRGECDIITHVPPESMRILTAVPEIDVLGRPATRSYFAEMNCVKPPLNDLRVRVGMNHAVDMEAVVDHILQGQGRVLPTVLLPNAFAYNASLKPYEYNPTKAKALFASSGFEKRLSIAISCHEDNRQFANILAVFLEKVGVKSVITITDSGRPKLTGPNAPWDIFVTSWGNSTLDPIGILVPKFHSDGRGNYSNYSDERVDSLLSMAAGSLDPHVRKKFYEHAQEIIYEDAPMIFSYAADEIYGVRKRVKNFIPSSSGMMNMHDVYVQNGD